MNDRQRILMLLRGGQPDRVPWLADLTYWATALEGRGTVPRGFQTSDAYYNWHRDLRVGFYLQGYEPYRATRDDTIKIEHQSVGNVSRTIIHTPKGSLYEEYTSLPESFTAAPTRHLISGPQDLAPFRYLIEHTRFQPDYAESHRRHELVKDLGLVLCYTPKSPFMQLVALQAGIEMVTELVYEASSEFESLLEVMEAKSNEAAALAVDSAAECLMIPENLSSEVVGTAFFEKYMRRYQEHWVRRIGAAGKFSFIHIDGTLRGLLREEGSVGFTVLEALTPAPVGDLPWASLRPLAGPGPILWGGIPGSYFTPLVSDAEFQRHVKEVLSIMRREPRYVLGVADQVPPDGLESRVRRVADMADEFGRY